MRGNPRISGVRNTSFDPSTPALQPVDLQEFDLAGFVPEPHRHLVEDSTILCAPATCSRIKVNLPVLKGLRRGYRISVTDPEFAGKLQFALGPGSGAVTIETRGPAALDIRIWRGGSFRMGPKSTVNGARVVCDNADVVVGEDALWSDEILIQSNDQHGIVECPSGELLNSGRRRIEIGPHVWLGRRTIVMPGVRIGSGSILATGAVLTKDMVANTIYAGVPAREIRRDVTWSRSPNGVSAAERDYLNRSPE